MAGLLAAVQLPAHARGGGRFGSGGGLLRTMVPEAQLPGSPDRYRIDDDMNGRRSAPFLADGLGYLILTVL